MWKFRDKLKKENGNSLVMFVVMFPAIWMVITFSIELALFTLARSSIQGALNNASLAFVTCNQPGNPNLGIDGTRTFSGVNGSVRITYELDRTSSSLIRGHLYNQPGPITTTQTLNGGASLDCTTPTSIPVAIVPTAPRFNCDYKHDNRGVNTETLIEELKALPSNPVAGGRCTTLVSFNEANKSMAIATSEFHRFVMFPSVFNNGYFRVLASSEGQLKN